ncbi:MAG: hypothetical protein ACYTFK_11140 [Planctomycetota bacterium]|jgi:hypothetical protein
MKHKKQKHLTKRQRVVIDELFEGRLDEAQVLAKHKVSTRLYRAWLGDEVFADELKFRIDSAKRASELIIAKYSPVAAAKLVGLIDSEKDETVRRACLDILASSRQTDEAPAEEDDSNEYQPVLPPDVASKLLAVLAEHKEDTVE